MQSFRLWLEPDPDIPRFKRLAFEKVKVSIADVLKKGIHPWMGGNVHPSLNEKFAEILNSEEMKISELSQFGYGNELYCSQPAYSCNEENSSFQTTLQHIRDSIRFVDRLPYGELLEIAKERLRQMWSHKVAYRLLSRKASGFDAIRTFLKARDKNIKLSGYEDIDRYDIARVVCLDDFTGDDAILISEGIPVINFRSAAFLSQVTDERGLLRLTDSIRDFQLIVGTSTGPLDGAIQYNCQSNGDGIRMVPELEADEHLRERAKSHASCLRTDNGRYCFTMTIAKLAEMLELKGCQITFPTLDYMKQREANTSSAKIQDSATPCFAVRAFLTANASGEDIKFVLRNHSVPITGRKEDLLEKLAQLAAKQYAKAEPSLDAYFGQHRFIRAERCSKTDTDVFPLLERHDLRNMLLTMYILRHLRGNTILEATHENDTYTPLDLARALIKREVSLTGIFLRVE
jgi:hypothetical protein